jgi:transcriptional regulator with XRE-family HTH domain
MKVNSLKKVEGLKVDGKKLAIARKNIGLSQRRLGNLVMVHPSFISHLECGRHSIQSHTLNLVGKVLGVNPQMLLLKERSDKKKIKMLKSTIDLGEVSLTDLLKEVMSRIPKELL